MAELVDERLERHAVLQRVADRLGEGVQTREIVEPSLAITTKDLARLTVLEEADRDVALVAADVELVRQRVPLVGQLAAHRRARGERRRLRSTIAACVYRSLAMFRAPERPFLRRVERLCALRPVAVEMEIALAPSRHLSR